MRKELSPVAVWGIIAAVVILVGCVVYNRTAGNGKPPADYVPARELVQDPSVRAKLVDMYKQKYGHGAGAPTH